MFNPCDDFYQFSCGNYIKKVKQSPNPTFSFSTQIYQKIISNIHQRIEKIIMSEEMPSDSNSLRKAKIFHQRCMKYGKQHFFYHEIILHFDNNNIVIPGKNDVVNFFLGLFSIVGGWPVLTGEKWNEVNFDWLKAYKVFKDKNLKNPYPAEVTESNGTIKV